MSKSRYKPVGNWRPSTEPVFAGGDQRYARLVKVEICDVREINGHLWPDGAYRVTTHGPEGRPPSHTFIGEMAWCNARRYAEDAIAKIARLSEGRHS